jgi:hypothetical protein
MFPDKKPVTPSTPASLPQVQFSGAAPQAVSTQLPLTPNTESVSTERELEQMVDKVKLLVAQYGANPYAFNAAFQQLKARYLLDHYHVDPNAEKN